MTQTLSTMKETSPLENCHYFLCLSLGVHSTRLSLGFSQRSWTDRQISGTYEEA